MTAGVWPRSTWSEINGYSWVLPRPTLDCASRGGNVCCGPCAALQPGGIHLLPAVSAVRDGFALLMICPFGLEPELLAMINNGYRIIGQRWTAPREEDGRASCTCPAASIASPARAFAPAAMSTTTLSTSRKTIPARARAMHSAMP